MSQDTLEKFEAYRLAMELFDLVVDDMTTLVKKPALQKMVPQQFGSADSIAANIEEGHGRETTKEYIRFLIYSRGSARETNGRYILQRRWFSNELIEDRTARFDHIIAILTKSIQSLRRRGD
jgi:four helix bundle protein